MKAGMNEYAHHLDKLPAILKKGLGRDLCTCNRVVKMDVIKAIIDGATTIEEVRRETYASTGIGCCAQQIERLIECLCEPDTE